MLTSQEEQGPGVQMEGWLPCLCLPSTQRLSAGEEARVYQRYTQLCCPSVCAAQGDLALKLRRPADRSPPATPPSRTQAPKGGAKAPGRGEDREEGSQRGWRSSHLDVAGAQGLCWGWSRRERKGQLWLLTAASPELSLIISSTLSAKSRAAAWRK